MFLHYPDLQHSEKNHMSLEMPTNQDPSLQYPGRPLGYVDIFVDNFV